MPLPLGLDGEVFVRVAAILAAIFVVSNVVYPEPLLDLTIGSASIIDPVETSSTSAATSPSNINGHSILSAVDDKNDRRERKSTYIRANPGASISTLTGTVLLSGPRDAPYEHKGSDLRAHEVVIYKGTSPSIFNARWITDPLDEFLKMWRTATFSGMITMIGTLVWRLVRAHGKFRKKKLKLTEEYETRLNGEKYRLIGEYEGKLRDEIVRLTAEFEPRLEQERRIAERVAYSAGEGLARRIVQLQAKYKYECETTEAHNQQILAEQVHTRQEYEEIIEDMGKTIQTLTAEIEDRNKVVGGLQAVVDGQSTENSGKDTILKTTDETSADWKLTIDRLNKDLIEKDAALEHRVNAVKSLRGDIEDWKESAKDALQKLYQGNMILEQEEVTKWSAQVIRLRRGVAELLKEICALQHEMWICNKKIATLETSVSSDRSYFMAALEDAHATIRKQTEQKLARELTKVEQNLPGPQIEVTKDKIGTKHNLATTNKHGDTSKAESGLTAAVPVMKAKAIEARSATDTTNGDQRTAGASDKSLANNPRAIEKAKANMGPGVSYPLDMTPMDILALQAEAQIALRTNSISKSQVADPNTAKLTITKTGGNIGSIANGSQDPQQTTADGASAGGDGQGKEEVIVNTRDVKPSPTVAELRKQVHHRGLRTPCTQCKSINLRCDHHRIACDNCHRIGSECSREHSKEGAVTPSTQDETKPAKPVKSTKLAIKLKEDCKLPASLEEIQHFLNNNICPICLKPGHKASECPEHLVFGKIQAAKEAVKQDNAEPSNTANSESILNKTLINLVEAESTTRQDQSTAKPTRKSGPLVVGASNSDESPTETKKLPIDTDKLFKQSKWADESSKHSSNTIFAVGSQTTRLPSQVQSPTESTPIRKGPDPTAPTFTPTAPASSFTPTAPVFTPSQPQSSIAAFSMPPPAPRALRNVQNGRSNESSPIFCPPGPRTPQAGIYVHTHPDSRNPGGYTTINSPNRARGSSRGRSTSRGRTWGRSQSHSQIPPASIASQNFATDAANGTDPDYEALGVNPLIDNAGASGQKGSSVNPWPKGDPHS